MTDEDGDDVGMAPPGDSAPGVGDGPQCAGTTTDGTRCEDTVIPGLDVCHRHVEQSDDLERAFSR